MKITDYFCLLVGQLRVEVGHASHQLLAAPHWSLDGLQAAHGRAEDVRDGLHACRHWTHCEG